MREMNPLYKALESVGTQYGMPVSIQRLAHRDLSLNLDITTVDIRQCYQGLEAIIALLNAETRCADLTFHCADRVFKALDAAGFLTTTEAVTKKLLSRMVIFTDGLRHASLAQVFPTVTLVDGKFDVSADRLYLEITDTNKNIIPFGRVTSPEFLVKTERNSAKGLPSCINGTCTLSVTGDAELSYFLSHWTVRCTGACYLYEHNQRAPLKALTAPLNVWPKQFVLGYQDAAEINADALREILFKRIDIVHFDEQNSYVTNPAALSFVHDHHQNGSWSFTAYRFSEYTREDIVQRPTLTKEEWLAKYTIAFEGGLNLQGELLTAERVTHIPEGYLPETVDLLIVTHWRTLRDATHFPKEIGVCRLQQCESLDFSTLTATIDSLLLESAGQEWSFGVEITAQQVNCRQITFDSDELYLGIQKHADMVALSQSAVSIVDSANGCSVEVCREAWMLMQLRETGDYLAFQERMEQRYGASIPWTAKEPDDMGSDFEALPL